MNMNLQWDNLWMWIIFRAVDGEWSDWKDWSPCSTTCGAGTQERERTCTEPRPAFGGNSCVGVSRESKSCQARACPGNIIVLTFFTEAWFSVRHRTWRMFVSFFFGNYSFQLLALHCYCVHSWFREDVYFHGFVAVFPQFTETGLLGMNGQVVARLVG